MTSNRYSWAALLREGLRGHTGWQPAWNDAAPKEAYDAVIIGEALERGEGVCRDFAHLGIALCRSLTIPARMVAGYLQDLEPMDLHAWFEAFVGGRWYTFDPTHPDQNKARVILALGRDAADVPVFNQFGPPVTPSGMHVFVREMPG